MVVVHMEEGQIYHFPIALDGSVSFNGSYFEPNREAERGPAFTFSKRTGPRKRRLIIRNNAARPLRSYRHSAQSRQSALKATRWLATS